MGVGTLTGGGVGRMATFFLSASLTSSLIVYLSRIEPSISNFLNASSMWPYSSASSQPNDSYKSSTSLFCVVARFLIILPNEREREREKARERGSRDREAAREGAREGTREGTRERESERERKRARDRQRAGMCERTRDRARQRAREGERERGRRGARE